MCFILHLTTFYACNHSVVNRRQKLDCNATNCVFSQRHRPEEHACQITCAQSLQDEQSFTTSIVTYPCDACTYASHCTQK
ncbi:hypothetical protein AB1N83_003883 [Pleurotus pulmonarius]